MREIWRRHSLSLTCIGIGLIVMLACIPLREGTSFDLISQLGGGLFSAGLLFLLAGPLHEENKPEE